MKTEFYIPKCMQKMNNWILWKVQEITNDRGETKKTKIPINPRTYGNAMSNNPETWSSFGYTKTKFISPKVDGIGFMLPLDGSMTMIDLDHCVDDDGNLNNFARSIMNRFKDTYMELSQSGKGVHIFCFGGVPNAVKTNAIEIYSKTRFCAMTGNCINKQEVMNYDRELQKLFDEYGKKVEQPKPVIQSVTDMSVAEIMEVIRKSQNADKFNSYFNGYTEKNSENTLGLASMLAFYCGNDRNKIKEIMNLSGLRREKFDRRTNGRTWLDLVIDKAIQSTREVYQPKEKNVYKPPQELKKTLEELEKEGYEVRFAKMSDVQPLNEEDIVYTKTGYKKLDDLIGGFTGGEVAVWSGLNGSGKSNFLMQQIIEYAHQGYKTMLFSGEMQDYVIKNTLLKMTAGKSFLQQSNDGVYWYLADKRIGEVITKWLDKYLLLYKNEYTMNADEIINAIRFVASKGIKLVVLDNLMTINLKVYDKDKYEAQSMFAKELARLTKELNIHIHVVMHPRKASGYLRKDDISGSADLSNAVDNVFIIHRVNADFKERVKDTYDARISNALFAFDNIIEVCKNRRHGVQDEFIGLYFERESKKFLSFRNEEKKYLLGLGGDNGAE